MPERVRSEEKVRLRAERASNLDDESITNISTTVPTSIEMQFNGSNAVTIIRSILSDHPYPLSKNEQNLVNANLQCFANNFNFSIVNLTTNVQYRWCDVLDFLELNSHLEDIILIDSQTVVTNVSEDLRRMWVWSGVKFGLIHSSELYDPLATWAFRNTLNVTERIIEFGCSKKWHAETNEEGPPFTYTMEEMGELFKQAEVDDIKNVTDTLQSSQCRKKYDFPKF
uniref:Uncharacterized protein n=1 Tax=Panagrellus redivivus TaxID=6233 RepID=A0A7E4VHA0_PANRE